MKHLKSLKSYGKLAGFGKGVLLAATLLLTLSFYSHGQSITVRGNVVGEEGEPIPGVFVQVQGSSTATATDIDGNFSINVAPTGNLLFSCVGFKEQLVKTEGRTLINIIMETDRSSLDEAVVVGYGVQKRRDIVGAIDHLSTDEISDKIGSSMNISRALQGTIPGLSLSFADGKPNRKATLRIRGNVNSIGSGGSDLN